MLFIVCCAFAFLPRSFHIAYDCACSHPWRDSCAYLQQIRRSNKHNYSNLEAPYSLNEPEKRTCPISVLWVVCTLIHFHTQTGHILHEIKVSDLVWRSTVTTRCGSLTINDILDISNVVLNMVEGSTGSVRRLAVSRQVYCHHMQGWEREREVATLRVTE